MQVVADGGFKVNVFLIARDMGPSQALGLLDIELRKKGHQTNVFLGYGKPFSFNVDQDWVINKALEADIVLSGMSSSQKLAIEEMVIAKAMIERGRAGRFGFFADTFNAWARLWLEPFREITRFLFTISQEEVIQAEKLFDRTEVVSSGNPAWENFFYLEVAREQARGKLMMGSDDVFILCPGSKSPAINGFVFLSVIEAVKSMDLKNFGRQCKIMLALHPGDYAPIEMYAEIAEFSDGIARILPTPTSQVVAGADIIIGPDSTIGIQAAHLRIPVIAIFCDISINRFAYQNGSKIWMPSKLGIAKAILGESLLIDLRHTINSLLSPDNSFLIEMRECQRQAFPKIEKPGKALEIIIDTLERIASTS